MPAKDLNFDHLIPGAPQTAAQKASAAQALDFDTVVPAADAPTLASAAKSVATGVRGAAEGTVGVFGDIPNKAAAATAFLARKLGVPEEQVAASEDEMRTGLNRVNPMRSTMLLGALKAAGVISPETADRISSLTAPTSRQVGAVTDAAVNALPPSVSAPVQDITRHEARNWPERAAETAGGFALGALAPTRAETMLGDVVTRGTRVAAPAIASEGAGEAVRKVAPDWEPAARFIAGIIGGGVSEAGMNSFKMRRAMQQLGTTEEAANYVQKLLVEQGMSPEDAGNAMTKLGARTKVIDTGPNTLQAGQQISARGGPGRAELQSGLKERKAASDTLLEQDISSTVGPRQQPEDITQAMKARLEAAQQAQKTSHAAQVAPADLTDVVDHIDSVIAETKHQPTINALNEAKRYLYEKPVPAEPGTEPTGPTLESASKPILKARQAIGDMLYDKNGKLKTDLSGGEYDALSDVYTKLNEKLDVANPTLRKADKDIEQIAKEENAFDTGQKIYENPRGAPTEVGFKKQFDAMTPGEQQQVLNGLNVETWRQLGINSNDRVALQKLLKGDGKWNHMKVAAVIGEDKATRLMDALERSKVHQNTYQKVVEGSKTAETVGGDEGPSLIGEAAKAVPEAAIAYAVGGPGAAGGVTWARLKRVLAEKMQGGDRPIGAVLRDRDVARLLMSEDPNQMVNVAQALKRRGNALQQAGLGGLLSQGGNQ